MKTGVVRWRSGGRDRPAVRQEDRRPQKGPGEPGPCAGL